MDYFVVALICVGLLCAAGLVFCNFLLWRNQKVFDYRTEVGRRISAAALDDINNGREWKWRYEAEAVVTYDEMMEKFWKPLDSFYTDKSFMEKR